MTQIEIKSSSPIESSRTDWKTRWMVAGGVMGALLGVLAVYLYIRSVESEGKGMATPRPIKPGAAVQVALAVLTAIRQFANLGLE